MLISSLKKWTDLTRGSIWVVYNMGVLKRFDSEDILWSQGSETFEA